MFPKNVHLQRNRNPWPKITRTRWLNYITNLLTNRGKSSRERPCPVIKSLQFNVLMVRADWSVLLVLTYQREGWTSLRSIWNKKKCSNKNWPTQKRVYGSWAKTTRNKWKISKWKNIKRKKRENFDVMMSIDYSLSRERDDLRRL